MSTPTPEEAFLEYARSTGWDETAVRVVLDTVRKARHAAALEMRGRIATWLEQDPDPGLGVRLANAVRALEV